MHLKFVLRQSYLFVFSKGYLFVLCSDFPLSSMYFCFSLYISLEIVPKSLVSLYLWLLFSLFLRSTQFILVQWLATLSVAGGLKLDGHSGPFQTRPFYNSMMTNYKRIIFSAKTGVSPRHQTFRCFKQMKNDDLYFDNSHNHLLFICYINYVLS